MEAANYIAQADRAAAAGNLRDAEKHLRLAVEAGSPDLELLLKLAGVQRAVGQTDAALKTVEQGLALSPRDFTALLLRASLLERIGMPGAAQAWSNALAQRPAGQMPPHLAAVVSQAEAKVQAWTAAREKQMEAASAEAESTADEDARTRIQRFRSNVLRQTRHYHSEPTHFHYPGLRELEFHPRQSFSWLGDVEAETEALTAELREVMSAERAELVPYVEYDDHLPMDQWRPLNRSLDWTAIHLIKNGEAVDANARHCPRAMELLARLPQPKMRGTAPNAMFSLLAPNTHIPPHVGVSNARLVCHLPLIVPQGCWFRVGAETRLWKVGEAFVFDDTIEHEAMNPTDELRVVLIFDTWHPDLSKVERDAVAALMESEGGAGGL